MKRRPPGLLALAALVLSGIPLSQAVQQDTVQRVGTAQPATHVPPVPAGVVDVSGDDIDPIEAAPRKRKHNGAKHQSPAEGQNPYVPNLSSETPVAPRKKTISSVVSDINHHDTILEDASALATFAPDQPSVVAPILPFNRADGLGSHLARSLNDWEVEDFVLLATVNGDLYATDRKSGKTRWHTQIDKPIVETKHHRLEISLFDDDFDDIDHYIWAIEPTGPGRIFLMVPGQAGFRPTTLTMKNLAEMPAHLDKDLSYTGRKESAILTLDAATGRVHGWYGSNDADEDFRQFAANSCERPDEFADSDACSMSGTITLGRTDYVVIIRRSDGPAIATLKYSEWAPNHADHQLELQNTQTRDNQYMTGKPDGQVYGMSYNDTTDNENPMVFRTSVSSPLARVFDIFRPSDAPTRSNPALMILPQPAPPYRDANEKLKRLTSVYLGQTEKGSWYALSGELYPLITRSGAALSQKEDGFWERQPRKLDVAQLRKSLAGRHTYGSIPKPRSGAGAGQVGGPSYPEILGLPGPETLPGEEIDNASTSTIPPNLGPAESPNVIEKMKEIPQAAADSFVDLFRNPLFILGVVAVLLVYRQNILRWYNEKKRDVKKREIPSLSRDSTGLSESELKIEDATTASTASKDVVPSIDDSTVTHPDSGLQDQAPELVSSTAHKVVAPGGGNSSPPESVTEVTESTDSGPTVKFAPLVETHEANKGPDEVSSELLASPEKKKKPAHRGRRGGKKHVKKNKQASPDADKESTPPTDTDANVDDAVRDAYKLGDTEKRLEPDYHTVATDPQDVSGPILRMGSMEVNEDQQLGTGSNGTVVFAGKWDGRDVAVKRMLIQFYDIASQETRLLRESDDHENVIRYYAQQQRDAFLYIALELCQASLAEVVEKPQHFRELAMAGERDLPGVLHQITNGLSHLHALRIVHRDLKPQNILVNMGKGGKPRLLVSDFGLCKKLEGGQSSFGATTAHAAGTSGWRAPELLLDDDARDTGTTLIDASSTHSGSGGLVSTDLLPNRRATRAIDIFSLGLVFYYVLTKGSHPFDCGDRYMREVNIRKNNFNLDALSALGDYAFEAKDLIRSMLNADPKHRPPALEVMAHPFFWSAKKRLNFLCDVSDHFEKEPRDPPSEELAHLESYAGEVCRGDFLKPLGSMFVESLGKQRKYTGTRMLDLLRALRNKRNHYEDMSETLKKAVGPLPEGYLSFWTTKFPNLLITCWTVVWAIRWDQTDRFRDYYQPNYS